MQRSNMSSLCWLLATAGLLQQIEALTTSNSTSSYANSTSSATSSSTSSSSSTSMSTTSSISVTITSIISSIISSANTSTTASSTLSYLNATSSYGNASTVFSASIPFFTPNATGVAYRDSSQCTADAMAYYSAHNTSVLTDFASVGVFTMTAPPGSTATTVITGQDSYTNSLGVITHPTFTFTLTGPTSTIFTDPAAYPTEDAMEGCCGVCSMPIFRPTIYYWPSGTPNTACLATCTGSTFEATGLASSTQISSSPTSTSPVSSSSSSLSSSDSTTTLSPHGGTATTTTTSSEDKPTTTSTSTTSTPDTTTTSSPTFSEQIPSQYSILTLRAEPTDIPNLDSNGGSVAQYAVGPDGYTYTSPYIYVVLTSVLAKAGKPECSNPGSTYTNIRYSFLPGELSTVEFRVGSTRALDFNDLPCPNSDVMYRNGWNDGSCGYQPFIAPLTQVQELDPAFASCWLPGCDLWDPPQPLSPQGSLWITTSAPDPGPTPATPQSQPAPQPSPSMFNPSPVGTLGSNSDPSPSPDPQSNPSPVRGGSPPSSPSPDPSPDPSPAGGDPSSGDPSSGGDPSGGDPGSGSDPGKNPGQPDSLASPAASPAITPGPTPGPAPLVVGSATAVIQSSTLIIGTNTITPGAPAVIISGTPVSLAPSATAVVIGSSTINLPAPGSPAAPDNNGGSPPSVVTVSGIALTPSGSGLIVGSQTLAPGGPPVVVSGTTLSLPGSGNNGGGSPPSIIIGGSTVPLPAPSPVAGSGSGSPITIGGATFTPIPSSSGSSDSGPDLVISGQTLTPGGPPVVVSGTTFSLPPGASSLVIDGSSTVPLPPLTPASAADPAVTGAPNSPSSLLTISAGPDGQLITLTPSGTDLIISGQTLTPGGPVVTIGPDTFSLAPGGGDVIVDGSSTVPLAQTTEDVGGVVYTAWVGGSDGGGGPAASASVMGNGTVMVFEGAAARGLRMEGMWVMVMVGLLGAICLL